MKAIIFTDQRLDDQGNSVVLNPTPVTTNRNPDLDQIVGLYRKGPDALIGMDDYALRQFGDMLSAAYDDNLVFDNLKRASFWNDIGGFVDEHGDALPSLAPNDTQAAIDGIISPTEGKIRYLARVIIPTCISTLVIYLRQKLNPDEPLITDDDPTIDAKIDVLNLRLLLKRLSV